jgi:hypothetical protein
VSRLARAGRDAVGLGLPIGVALGALATLLFVAIDPHTRAAMAAFLPGRGAVFLAAMSATSTVAFGLAGWLSAGEDAGRRARLLRGATPILGAGLALALSPAAPWTGSPALWGPVVTSPDLAFGVAWLVLAVVLFRPLAALGSGSARQVAGLCGTSAILLGALAGVTVSGDTSGDTAEPVRPAASLVLIGIDGADMGALGPRIGRGLVPNLAALVRNGASGDLATFRPTWSPVVWTTIATGEPPAIHGIEHFTAGAEQTPVTSNLRRVPTLWTRLGDAGIRVAVAGWWVTWPAEPVNGHMVSSASVSGVGLAKGTLLSGLEDQTYPPDLWPRVEPILEHAARSGGMRLARLKETANLRPVDDLARRESVAAWIFAADIIFGESATLLASEEHPRFLAVYFGGTDTLAHLFCEGGEQTDAACNVALDEAWTNVDAQIGALLAAMPPDADVIVVSDHGFDLRDGHHGHGRFQGLPGLAIWSGPGVRAGARIPGASIYDVAPTALARLGVPIPVGWRGRPWLGALEPEAAGATELRWTRRDTPRSPAGPAEPVKAVTDEAALERLRALGYIE